jgi:hypothetical protein
MVPGEYKPACYVDAPLVVGSTTLSVTEYCRGQAVDESEDGDELIIRQNDCPVCALVYLMGFELGHSAP